MGRKLQTTARTLSACCGSFDLVVRWGGEEFIMFLGVAAADDLLAAADRVRQLVAHSVIWHDGQPVRTTVSIGATLALPGDDGVGLLERADELLYEAKRGGRNCTRLAA